MPVTLRRRPGTHNAIYVRRRTSRRLALRPRQDREAGPDHWRSNNPTSASSWACTTRISPSCDQLWDVETIIASAIAVLGTLLGSGITLAVQQRTTDRSHEFTRREKLRQERLDAYSSYAGALLNYRRCLVHLWFCENEEPPPEDPDAVRIRAYDLRSGAQEALFRVQMLTDDETLSQTAETVLADVTALAKTETRTELDQRRVRTRDDINRLVRAAKRHL